jgi:predicted TIM-barrel fold metal-dependent hydrolase
VIIDAHVALGAEHHLHLDSADLVRALDDHGVSIAVARPLGTELVVYNTRGNDRLLTAGPCIRALITANPWYGERALEELKRCHERGAVGLYLHPTRQGFMPTDPIAEPLVALAGELNWPVTFHTGTYIQSDVLAVAELARRFPHINFICDSAGFSDMWFELPGLIQEHQNLLLCVSFIWSRAILNAVRAGSVDRILFGSGQPRDELDVALGRIHRLALGAAEMRAILHDNAARVFKL